MSEEYRQLLNAYADMTRNYALAIQMLEDVATFDYSKIGAVQDITRRVNEFLTANKENNEKK